MKQIILNPLSIQTATWNPRLGENETVSATMDPKHQICLPTDMQLALMEADISIIIPAGNCR